MNQLLRRALALAAVIGAVVVAAPAGVPGSPAAAHAVVGDCTPGADWGTLRQDLASQVVVLVNQHRASLGLTQLTVTTPLTNSAIWKSRHMAYYRYMQHADPAPPVARNVGDRLLACGYPSTSAGWGENIAYGYASATSVMQGWLNSPGHRANLENASFRAIGVGAAATSTGTLYWTQQFGTSTTGGTAPPPPPPPAPACSNSKDDDGDGRIDFPADPGCSSTADTNEQDAPPPPPPPPPPSGSVSATPYTATLNTGTYLSGFVSSLNADDGRYLRLGSSSSSVLWYGRMSGVPNTLKSLNASYRGFSSAACTQTLWFYNWTTATWTSVGSSTLGTTESETVATATGSLADYVGGTTGNGDVVVRVGCTGSGAFTSSSDLLKITYTP
ncbi:MAG: CAP domain-containing protein [Gaiellaceae bacterium]